MTKESKVLPRPAEMSDLEILDLMESAFTTGLIEPADRAPMIELLGEKELLFYFRPSLANAQDALFADVDEGGGVTIRLTLDVQRRLKERLWRFLSIN